MPVIVEVSEGGNVTYYINEEKRVVVAKINTDVFEPIRIMASTCEKYVKKDTDNAPFAVYGKYSYNKSCIIKNNYVGIARCSPEDTFDKSIGKAVAFARAQYKYHRDMANALGSIAHQFHDLYMFIESRSIGHRTLANSRLNINAIIEEASGTKEES